MRLNVARARVHHLHSLHDVPCPPIALLHGRVVGVAGVAAAGAGQA